ncbi:MAG: GGDEF domain-containing protein [Steroidobacteraceae bacterium]
MIRFPDSTRSPANPPSPYEAELARGTIALRFPPKLEREFRKSHMERLQQRARIWSIALLAMCGLSTLYRLFVDADPVNLFETILRLAVLMPAAVAVAIAAWNQRVALRYARVAMPASMLVSIAVSVLVARAVADHGEAALTSLTTFMFASFFLVGLQFFDSLLVAAAGVVAFGVAGWLLGMPPGQLLYDVLLVLSVAAVGTWIAFGVEQTNRRAFLERGALGDLAERDGLTGLRNRRAFDEQLARVWQQSLRDRSGLAILLIDIDHFKAYNDFYGHQAGDACLCHVSQIVQRFARRPLDVAARYGGEELAIVLYQVTREHALAVAEQLRFTVEAARIEHRGAPMRDLVTVSVGVAWVEATLDRSPEEVVQLADQALYTAKLAGRNGVRFMSSGDLVTFERTLRLVPRVESGPVPAA